MNIKNIDPVEKKRLEALASYEISIDQNNKEFDSLTRLAAFISDCPVAVISFIDHENQWIKSKIGTDETVVPLKQSLCKFLLNGERFLEVPNVNNSNLIASHPEIFVPQQMQFYAGLPLMVDDEQVIGTLCVYDNKAKELSENQKDALITLALQIVSNLDLVKQQITLNDTLKTTQEFKSMFNSSPELLIITNYNIEILMINDSLRKTFGYKDNEFVGHELWDFIDEKDKLKTIQIVNAGLKNKIKQFEFETKIINKAGEIKWISWRCVAKDGRWYSSGRDITLQKETLNNLIQMSAAVAKVNNGVVIGDEYSKIVYVNNAFERITGYNLADLQGKRLGDVIIGVDTDMAEVEKARNNTKNKKSFNVDLLVYRKDGQPIWVSIFNTIIVNADGVTEREIEFIIDITDKKEAEKKLIEAKEQALQLSNAKEMFLSVMSHEIRTPLNAIIGMSHILSEDINEHTTPEQIENLDILKFSADNLMRLINNVLDYTKIETGNIVLDEQSVNLKELIDDIIHSLQFKVASKNIILRLNTNDLIPDFILADRTRLYQILINLLNNAIKFTNKGSVEIRLSVLNQDLDNILINFEIIDTGIGIPEDKLEFVFESFKQAHLNANKNYGGTGLGLAITKSLVELHGSKIKVESRVNEGTNFSFAINFKKTNQMTQIEHLDKEDHHLNCNILVVDDNEINRFLIQKVLLKWGVSITFAEDGEEAIEKVKTKNFDIVLMDIHMPVMSGLEATQIIRKLDDQYFRDLPIIALTASVLSTDVDDIFKNGMTDYQLKPFNPDSLFQKINKYLPQKA